jgi:hypothetical protein
MLKATASKAGFAVVVAGGAWLALSAVAIGGSAVTSGSKAAEVKACVAPTEDMRRNHMEYIKHERNLTVHLGIRGGKYSLAQCVDCHTASNERGTWVAVNAQNQFCNACHTFAAVHVDCFDCHRNTPQQAKPQVIPALTAQSRLREASEMRTAVADQPSAAR